MLCLRYAFFAIAAIYAEDERYHFYAAAMPCRLMLPPYHATLRFFATVIAAAAMPLDAAAVAARFFFISL